MRIEKIISFLLIVTLLFPTNIFAVESNLTSKKFSSKAELEKYVQNSSKANDYVYEIMEEESSVKNSPMKSNSTDSFSTNNQVSGIDEGDIIKTSGNYIYYAYNNMVQIINSSNENTELITTITLNNENIQAIYVENETLIVISNSYNKGYSSTMTSIYDIHNPKSPKLIRTLSLEGYLNTSRFQNSILYIITYQSLHYKLPTPIPRVSDTLNSAINEIDYSKIAYCPIIVATGYTNIMAVDTSKTEDAQFESLLGNNNQVYMSKQNLYLGNYNYNTSQTVITKYKIDGVKLTMGNSETITGSILNQFSMDEYNENLRVTTTFQKWSGEQLITNNQVYVLNKNMKIIGSLKNFAPDERIYSARFDGDIGYIVTFKEVDPLFTIDLSDPTSPKILGELKIPGYSLYIHKVSNNLALGIGRDIQELYIKNNLGNEIFVGTREGGIKLSLFDVSNPLAPIEKDVLVLGGNGSYSEALYNHKSLMVNPQKSDFGFMAILSGDNPNASSFQGSLIVNINNGQLSLKGNIPLDNSSDIYEGRIVYINDKLFVVTPQGITTYNYSNLNKLSTIKF